MPDPNGLDWFEEKLRERSASSFAGFLLPHLQAGHRILDCGCGSGSISVGLTDLVGDCQIVAFDLDASQFESAIRHMDRRSVSPVRFLGADGHALPFNDATFDAALCHSMLETLPDPEKVVREIVRVLVPGGVFGAASVDYGGLILAGPDSDVLERFYTIREALWDLESLARSRAGRDLRGLLHAAGFSDIVAGARYVSYGDPEAIRTFGEARASECADSWFSSRAVERGCLTESQLKSMEVAWRSWSTSPDAFLAFPWLHATGRKSALRK